MQTMLIACFAELPIVTNHQNDFWLDFAVTIGTNVAYAFGNKLYLVRSKCKALFLGTLTGREKFFALSVSPKLINELFL